MTSLTKEFEKMAREFEMKKKSQRTLTEQYRKEAEAYERLYPREG